jgi:hypothetical protein
MTNLLKVYSEIHEAFAAPGNLLTRGDHFHNEAVRLWELEEGRRSITNMQALLILALGYAVCHFRNSHRMLTFRVRTFPRGKCQLGWNFVKIAAAQNRSLSIPNPDSALRADAQSAEYARARACVANSIVSANM